jgi:cytochrome c oxidase subunit 2
VQTHGNNMLEVVWTIIPALIVTGLFVLTVQMLTRFDTVSATTESPAGLTIDVTGFQWQWTFDYPDQGLSFTGTGREGPVMALPVGEDVHIRLHAADVIHSFYVPQFLYKKDVIPGHLNEFDVRVEQAGTYSGQCAEFCGLAHADMHFTVQAMSRAEFDAWVAQNQQPVETQAPPPPPDGAPEVTVTAVSVTEGFQPTELQAPADQPWTVQLDNSDPNVPHNFSIHSATPEGDWIGQPNANGGETAVYQPPPLAAGDYEFFCSLHPNMKGTLHVGQ